MDGGRELVRISGREESFSYLKKEHVGVSMRKRWGLIVRMM